MDPGSVFGGIVGMAIFGALAAGTTRAKIPDVEDGYFVLRYGRALPIIVGVLYAAGLGVALLPLFIEFPWEVSIVLGLIFAAATTPLAIEGRSMAKISENEVVTRSVWRGEHRIAWADVTKVSFSTVTGWFTLSSAAGDKIRISGMFQALPMFVRILETQLCDEGGAKAATKWRRAMAAFGAK